MRNKTAIILLFVLAFTTGITSQVLKPVTWKFSINRIDNKHVDITAIALIEKPWHLYSTNIPDGGPVPTSLNFDSSDLFTPTGKLTEEPKAVLSYDESFQMEVGYFSNSAKITQRVEVKTSDAFVIKGFVEFMACDDSRCLPPDQVDFELQVPGVNTSEEQAVTDLPVNIDNGNMTGSISKPVSNETGDVEKSLWSIFWFSFLGGLAALLTPCVFPMIPLTVSFFLRNANNRVKAFSDGFTFGLTIIFAYVVLGLAIAMIFGADKLNNLSTSYGFNIIFFALLVFFASSFFGSFELTMPSKWSNSLDQTADKTGGFIGVVLMGLTFVLVSFSCTGPIVGTLLVEAAVGGNLFSPAIGMFGFSLALAIPFTLFAIFPTAMKSLPKSGGWMNSVKVVLGFIVLALSLKFLSVADSVGEWGILDREVFLVLWIAIFSLMGLYLIGKIKFAHDSELSYLSVPRLLLSIATFAFVFYLIPGLWGAPLKAISSFLPSTITQDFDLTLTKSVIRGDSTNGLTTAGKSAKPGPFGLIKYTDYDEGFKIAKEKGKPVFLEFTGKGCANCRKMESLVWSDATVRNNLANEFILISLYVDDREVLPQEQQYVSDVTGKKIRTIGNKWSDMQIKHYQSNSQPLYVILDHNGETTVPVRGFDTDVKEFILWMEQGISIFKERTKNNIIK